MLDALVAEARLRWGLDLGAGLQVIAAERLAGTPLEPSRPALIVPLAVLRARDGGAASAASPLPGRHGPGGDEPLSVIGRLYPADHLVGRFGHHAVDHQPERPVSPVLCQQDDGPREIRILHLRHRK